MKQSLFCLKNYCLWICWLAFWGQAQASTLFGAFTSSKESKTSLLEMLSLRSVDRSSVRRVYSVSVEEKEEEETSTPVSMQRDSSHFMKKTSSSVSLLCGGNPNNMPQKKPKQSIYCYGTKKCSYSKQFAWRTPLTSPVVGQLISPNAFFPHAYPYHGVRKKVTLQVLHNTTKGVVADLFEQLDTTFSWILVLDLALLQQMNPDLPIEQQELTPLFPSLSHVTSAKALFSLLQTPHGLIILLRPHLYEEIKNNDQASYAAFLARVLAHEHTQLLIEEVVLSNIPSEATFAVYGVRKTYLLDEGDSYFSRYEDQDNLRYLKSASSLVRKLARYPHYIPFIIRLVERYDVATLLKITLVDWLSLFIQEQEQFRRFLQSPPPSSVKNDRFSFPQDHLLVLGKMAFLLIQKNHFTMSSEAFDLYLQEAAQDHSLPSRLKLDDSLSLREEIIGLGVFSIDPKSVLRSGHLTHFKDPLILAWFAAKYVVKVFMKKQPTLLPQEIKKLLQQKRNHKSTKYLFPFILSFLHEEFLLDQRSLLAFLEQIKQLSRFNHPLIDQCLIIRCLETLGEALVSSPYQCSQSPFFPYVREAAAWFIAWLKHTPDLAMIVHKEETKCHIITLPWEKEVYDTLYWSKHFLHHPHVSKSLNLLLCEWITMPKDHTSLIGYKLQKAFMLCGLPCSENTKAYILTFLHKIASCVEQVDCLNQLYACVVRLESSDQISPLSKRKIYGLEKNLLKKIKNIEQRERLYRYMLTCHLYEEATLNALLSEKNRPDYQYRILSEMYKKIRSSFARKKIVQTLKNHLKEIKREDKNVPLPLLKLICLICLNDIEGAKSFLPLMEQSLLGPKQVIILQKMNKKYALFPQMDKEKERFVKRITSLLKQQEAAPDPSFQATYCYYVKMKQQDPEQMKQKAKQYIQKITHIRSGERGPYMGLLMTMADLCTDHRKSALDLIGAYYCYLVQQREIELSKEKEQDKENREKKKSNNKKSEEYQKEQAFIVEEISKLGKKTTLVRPLLQAYSGYYFQSGAEALQFFFSRMEEKILHASIANRIEAMSFWLDEWGRKYAEKKPTQASNQILDKLLYCTGYLPQPLIAMVKTLFFLLKQGVCKEQTKQIFTFLSPICASYAVEWACFIGNQVEEYIEQLKEESLEYTSKKEAALGVAMVLRPIGPTPYFKRVALHYKVVIDQSNYLKNLLFLSSDALNLLSSAVQILGHVTRFLPKEEVYYIDLLEKLLDKLSSLSLQSNQKDKYLPLWEVLLLCLAKADLSNFFKQKKEKITYLREKITKIHLPLIMKMVGKTKTLLASYQALKAIAESSPLKEQKTVANYLLIYLYEAFEQKDPNAPLRRQILMEQLLSLYKKVPETIPVDQNSLIALFVRLFSEEAENVRCISISLIHTLLEHIPTIVPNQRGTQALKKYENRSDVSKARIILLPYVAAYMQKEHPLHKEMNTETYKLPLWKKREQIFSLTETRALVCFGLNWVYPKFAPLLKYVPITLYHFVTYKLPARLAFCFIEQWVKELEESKTWEKKEHTLKQLHTFSPSFWRTAIKKAWEKNEEEALTFFVYLLDFLGVAIHFPKDKMTKEQEVFWQACDRLLALQGYPIHTLQSSSNSLNTNNDSIEDQVTLKLLAQWADTTPKDKVLAWKVSIALLNVLGLGFYVIQREKAEKCLFAIDKEKNTIVFQWPLSLQKQKDLFIELINHHRHWLKKRPVFVYPYEKKEVIIEGDLTYFTQNFFPYMINPVFFEKKELNF